MKKITILTRQVSISASILISIRNFLRFLKYFITGGITDFDILFFSGHTAVTKSLINGLRQDNILFNYNPYFPKDVGDIVFVLSDVKALKQAIDLKKSGKIKTLIAGPNVVELPTNDHMLSSSKIDLVLVPSKITVDIYEKLSPALTGKVVSWYAGVDVSYWKPTNLPKEKEVLVYWKNAPKAFCLEVELILKRKGYKINRIIYGHYNRKHFKKLLQKSMFAVFLSLIHI